MASTSGSPIGTTSSPAPSTPRRPAVLLEELSSGPNITSQSATATASYHARTPSSAPDDQAERSFSSGGDDSVVFSSGGSVVYHPRKSDSSFASSFEALSLTSSVIAAGSDATAPASSSPGRQEAKADSPLSRLHREARSVKHDQEELSTPCKLRTTTGHLNPAAPTFDARRRLSRYKPSGVSLLFTSILRAGKNANGDLSPEAKRAMAQLGLKAIPSLHGTSLLPYSRNPSGSDAYRFTVEDDEHGFEPIPDHEIEFFANHRTVPLPLPGNARYTPTGRQVLAQQRRNVSAPAAPVSDSNSLAVKAQATARRVVTAPSLSSKPDPTFPSHGQPAMPTTTSGHQHRRQPMMQQLHQQQSYDEAFATQALLARHAQQIQLAQAQAQAQAQTQAVPFSSPLLSPFSPTSPPSSGSSHHVGSPFPSLSTPYSFPFAGVIPSGLGYHLSAQRRPSIVVSPSGGVSFVDSNALLHLATQQGVDASGHAGGSSGTGSGQSSRMTSYGTVPDTGVPDTGSSEEPAVSEDEQSAELAAFAASERGRRRPSRAEQLDRRRRKHRPTLSDANITAHTYLEQGRRKSAMASFPPPGGRRRPSVASTEAPELRHASSGAAFPPNKDSSSGPDGPWRRASLAPESLATAYRPPQARRRSSLVPDQPAPSLSLPDVGNVPSAGKSSAQVQQQLHSTFQQPLTAPVVQIEPPTPKAVRTTARSASSTVVTTNSGLPTFPTPSINSSGSSDGTITPGPEERGAPVVHGAKPKGSGRWRRREQRKGHHGASATSHSHSHSHAS